MRKYNQLYLDFISSLIIAKAETPEPEFEPDQTKPMADSEPVNTLIEALERDITEVWSYKDQFKDADSLGLDNEKVNENIKLYIGKNSKLLREL